MATASKISTQGLQQLEVAFDSAAFLYLLRDSAVNQPNYFVQDILDLDARLEAYFDLLAVAPEESWLLAENALQLRQPGEIFVTSILAFKSLDVRKIQISVEAGVLNLKGLEALADALAWLPGRFVHSWIKKFLSSKDMNHKLLGLMVCSRRGEDPEEHLRQILLRPDCRSNERLWGMGLRLVGELKRFDLVPLLREALMADDKCCVFWAQWSQIITGDLSGIGDLEPWVLTSGELQVKALNLALRVAPPEVAKKWITLLSQNPQQLRYAIQASAIYGDPQAIPWLIAQMQIPTVTQIAGEAFSFITGIDLEVQKLILEDIPDLENQLPDDGAQNQLLDVSEDQYLPFPNAAKIAAVWQKYQHRFKPGCRYIVGHLIDNSVEFLECLKNSYANASMRQRQQMALELALQESGRPLVRPGMRIMEEVRG